MTRTTRRTRGAGSIFKDARGLWHFRRQLDPDPATGARRTIEATGKVKSEARARFDAKVEEYERTGVIRTAKGPYLRDYAERWLDQHRADVKPNTWANERSWTSLICQHIGGLRLTELRPEHIQTMIRTLSRTRKPSSIRCYLCVLSSMLDAAEREDLIAANPMRRVQAPKLRKPTRAILADDEPRRLIESAGEPVKHPSRYDDTPEEREMWGLMFELAFSTGMRPGERYALMPYQLERRRDTPGIYVCQQIQLYLDGPKARIPDWLDATHLTGRAWLTTPKSQSGNRFIPVSEQLWNRLWDHIAAWGIGPHQLIFANGFGRPIRRDNEILRWKRALADAGLPTDITIYSARHWLSTEIAEAGASDDERMLIMGHADLSTTARYTHWSPQALGRVIGRAIPDLAAAE
ncbi:tyrosine-type recombinase/integrase [Bifidobacterium callitrichos]|uniref:Site-specific recombinase, phage integrase family n=1 Tax=Bifidobacterium callitrichos DSM 23973 TaxID=1437609 RepID=A0A087ACP4_9BIFI|nr:tyrosine-type recombinase/integrase [Bifidobacterium callitrichos]KFI56544.1 site-specific recombinase, phage integrase family [Bifidobacterium callitrichos DSM 23973]